MIHCNECMMLETARVNMLSGGLAASRMVYPKSDKSSNSTALRGRYKLHAPHMQAEGGFSQSKALALAASRGSHLADELDKLDKCEGSVSIRIGILKKHPRLGRELETSCRGTVNFSKASRTEMEKRLAHLCESTSALAKGLLTPHPTTT